MSLDKKLSNIGIDRLIEMEGDVTLEKVAETLNTTVGSIRRWIFADEGRAEKWKATMLMSAWEDMDAAGSVIDLISPDAEYGEIKRAEMKVKHFYTLAKAKAPEIFGERKDAGGNGGITVVIQQGLGNSTKVEKVINDAPLRIGDGKNDNITE